MKILFIECNMGAAGDMLLAALLELHPKPDDFIAWLNNLGIPNVNISKKTSVKSGISGTSVIVRVGSEEELSHDIELGKINTHTNPHTHAHDHSHTHSSAHEHGHNHEHSHEHSHTHNDSHQHGHTHTHSSDHHHIGMIEIEEIVQSLSLSEQVKTNVLAVYQLIAEAESKAHGKPINAVHFHEVGMMDAIADIVGVCQLMEELAPEQVFASPIHVGSGQVKCAHGILPVPAPATAFILKGVPTYGGQIEGELCTPTGAALLKHFVNEFGDRPLMRTSAIGYGMGQKDFAIANCVRTFLGSSEARENTLPVNDIVEIVCNLDDMTGEELGLTSEILFANGALDVYITAIQMKKNRPAHKLACLCRLEDKEKMIKLILKHTSTFGVRYKQLSRYTLERSISKKDTKYGSIDIKNGSGFGLVKSKPEFDQLAQLIKENDLSHKEGRDLLL